MSVGQVVPERAPRWGRGGRGVGDRGAVAVEAALVLPLFFLVLFGIAEFALLMRDTLSVTESARVGARTASAMPRQGTMSERTVEAIGRAGTAMPKSNITQVLVYRANDDGYPGPAGAHALSCSGLADCDRYVWDASAQAFVLASGTPWDPRSGDGAVNACPLGLGGPGDSVGVYVEASHSWVTGLFGSDRTLSERVVLPFEVLQPAVCR